MFHKVFLGAKHSPFRKARVVVIRPKGLLQEVGPSLYKGIERSPDKMEDLRAISPKFPISKFPFFLDSRKVNCLGKRGKMLMDKRKLKPTTPTKEKLKISYKNGPEIVDP